MHIYSAFRIVLQVVNGKRGEKGGGSFLIKEKKENNAFINDSVLDYNKTSV